MTTGPSSRRCAPPRAPGFTLLELVLVMMIICTVLAVAAPSLRGFFVSRKTNDTADRIVALTRLARSQAVSEGRVYRLEFGREGRTYRLTKQEAARFEALGTSLGNWFRVANEVSLTLERERSAGAREHIDFFPDGRTEPTVIRLTDIKGGVLEVVCPAPTEEFRIRTPEENE